MRLVGALFVVDGRARLLWRFAAYFFFCALPRFLGSRLYGLDTTGPLGLVTSLAGACVRGGGVVLVTVVFRRFLDKRTWSPLGLGALRGRALDLAAGALTGGGLIALVFCVELALGWVRIDGFELDSANAVETVMRFAGAAFVVASVGLDEELVFRGYVLQNVAERQSMWAATLVSGLLFGLAHAHAAGFDAGFLVAMLLFTACCVASRILTGSIWFAIAFHASWDLVQSSVLGLSETGEPDHGHAVLHLTQLGPAQWVGAPTHLIEGGWLFWLALLLALLVLAALVRARGKHGDWFVSAREDTSG